MNNLVGSDERHNLKKLCKGLLSKDFTEIYPFEIFSLKNFIPIAPKKTKKKPVFQKQTKISQSENKFRPILDSIYEKPIKEKLREIFKNYYEEFEEICIDVIKMKYNNIFNLIFEHMRFIKYCEDTILRTIVINTDQNANEFFQSLEEFIGGQFKSENSQEARSIFIAENQFKDLKCILSNLKIFSNGVFLVKNLEKIERLIIVREIPKIDKVNFNIFLSAMINYHKNPDRIFNNTLIFDVSYDPLSLYEKIKPNNLCRMKFSNVENIPSKNIYQEVLYRFIFENKTNLFIPNCTNLKKIVDYLNNHQISIKSFKHYFKFLLVDFFLIESWSRDEYLIYSTNRDSSKEGLEKFFKEELINIYGVDSTMYDRDDILHLVKFSIDEKNNRDLFLSFYKFLEGLVIHLNTLTKDQMYSVDKYKFFFDFLQLGYSPEKVSENRTNLLKLHLERIEKADYPIITKNIILNKLKHFIDSDSFVNKIEKNNENISDLQKFVEKLENLVKNSKAEDFNKHFDSKILIKNSRNSEVALPSLMNNDQFLDELLMILKKNFFSIKFFSYMDKNENRSMKIRDPRLVVNSVKNYIVFTEIVNPNLSSIVINILFNHEKIIKDEMKLEKISKRKKSTITKMITDSDDMSIVEEPINFENFKENYTFSKLIKHYIILFSQAPTEFKLKFLFAEYLNQFGVEYDNLEKVEIMKNHFLYFSHIFYLLGYISRKRTNKDVFIKNYFQVSNYFNKLN